MRAAAGVKKFVYAASSSCYGLAATPTREDHPIAPQYPYALSKFQGEQAALHWHKVYRLPVNSIRIFNAYGTRSRTSGAYGAVFGVFLKQKLAGKPFTVVGDGTQSRDFLYVTDVAAAFLRAAETPIMPARSGTSAPATRNRSTGWSNSSAARSCIFQSGRANPIAPSPISAKSGATWAGRPKISFEAWRQRVSSRRSNIGATLRSGTPDTIARATTTWFKTMANKNTVILQ